MIITLDFETFYRKGYGFRTHTTESYIRDSEFEVIGVAVKVDNAPAVWVTGTKEQIRARLISLPWADAALLCHNALFDGAVLKWVFGIAPSVYLDTLCMGRAVVGVDSGGSLASLSSRFNLGVKGDEVVHAEGKRREDFDAESLRKYGEYCCNDAELTYRLWHKLSEGFPEEELKLIDMTLRMFIHPILEVDDALLCERLEELKQEKLELLGTLKSKLSCIDEEAVRKKLASNKQFAELLKQFDVTVPMKTSPTTGKQTFALAKNDEGFIALTEHEDPFIQQLCAVRLGTKSTLEESRIERFIDIGKRNRGRLPIPLKYYGAHTGRWSGLDKVNFQNLPSRDIKKKALKNAVVAPDGYMVINCDSSQIEARILAWLAGQEDVVQQFADGEDVYSVFASKIYEREITKADPLERFVGKTCVLGLGYGTGAAKLQHTLATAKPISVKLEEEKCKEFVDKYRDVNDKIIELWEDGNGALKDLCNWGDSTPYWYGQKDCVQVTKEGLLLPNSMYIRYPMLELGAEEAGKYSYKSRRGTIGIWGGSVVENVVQALARIVVGQQMLKIQERYKVVLTVHDAAVCVVEEDDVDSAVAYIVEVMSQAPDWAEGLPVACEAKFGKSYGDC